MKAPEKIYVHIRQKPFEITFSEVIEKDVSNIEYTRTDAFIDKACKYISLHQCEYIDFEDFKNYMKGE